MVIEFFSDLSDENHLLKWRKSKRDRAVPSCLEGEKKVREGYKNEIFTFIDRIFTNFKCVKGEGKMPTGIVQKRVLCVGYQAEGDGELV